MATLSATQTTALAMNFLSLAQTVGNYRMDHFDALSDTENTSLSSMHRQLLDQSDHLFTTSAKLVMNDVADSLQTIATTTNKINKTVGQLENVQKVINIVTSFVQLGTAIFSKNPGAIGGAIKDLVAGVQNLALQ